MDHMITAIIDGKERPLNYSVVQGQRKVRRRESGA